MHTHLKRLLVGVLSVIALGIAAAPASADFNWGCGVADQAGGGAYPPGCQALTYYTASQTTYTHVGNVAYNVAAYSNPSVCGHDPSCTAWNYLAHCPDAPPQFGPSGCKPTGAQYVRYSNTVVGAYSGWYNVLQRHVCWWYAVGSGGDGSLALSSWAGPSCSAY